MKELFCIEKMDIIGFEGLYKIYDDGRVFSVKRDKFLKQSMGNNGRYHVKLCKDGKRRNIRIHNLVATHFLGERPIGMEIDHKDRDKLNNNVSNLRYISKSDNCKNKYVSGKIPYRHIYKHGNGYHIQIKKNNKFIFNKCSTKWTLEDAIKVRNDAYIKLGIEIDDRVAPV